MYFSSSEVYGDFDGVMSEDVMDKVEIKQMNDYAMSKWVNEMQVLNSATQFHTPIGARTTLQHLRAR